jgi:hypothetical protein
VEADAAAQKKRGFWGGAGNFLKNQLKFAHRLIDDGPEMNDKALNLAATYRDDDSSMGDAAAFEAPAGKEVKTSKADGLVADSKPTLLPTLAGAGATAVNSVGGMFSDQFGGLKEIADGTMSSSGPGAVTGAVGGGIGAIGGLAGVMQNTAKAKTSGMAGNSDAAMEAKMDVVKNASGVLSGALNTAGFLGVAAGDVAKKYVPGLGLVTGAAQTFKGLNTAGAGIRTQEEMSSQINMLVKEGSPQFEDNQRVSMLRSLQLARAMGAINEKSGKLDAVAGALGTAGSAVTLTGAGALAGTVLSGAGAGLGALNGINKGVEVSEMRERVADQELNMSARMQRLEAYLASKGEDANQYSKETKEKIILQSMGYKSGTKKEAFMNIAMNRSKSLSDMANTHTQGLNKKAESENSTGEKLRGEDKYNWGDTAEDQERLNQYRQRKFARATLKGMGLDKVATEDGTSGYALQGVAEKLGMDAGVDVYHQLAESRKGSLSDKILSDKDKEEVEAKMRQRESSRDQHQWKQKFAEIDERYSTNWASKLYHKGRKAWHGWRVNRNEKGRAEQEKKLLESQRGDSPQAMLDTKIADKQEKLDTSISAREKALAKRDEASAVLGSDAGLFSKLKASVKESWYGGKADKAEAKRAHYQKRLDDLR